MDKNNPIIYQLAEIRQITHDTRQFTFPIPPGVDFDFLPGDNMKIYPDPSDLVEWRQYTPTTTPTARNYFQLIIKRYDDGQVSRFMHDRQVGDKITMSGPHEGGHYIKGMARRIGLVAGGTGITPFVSIIRTIISEQDGTDVMLLFANKSVDDIILKDEFDSYAGKFPNFDRYYIVDTAPEGWDMGIGRITPDLMSQKLPTPSGDTTIFVCGPPMMQIDLRKKLIELGHAKDKIIFP